MISLWVPTASMLIMFINVDILPRLSTSDDDANAPN